MKTRFELRSKFGTIALNHYIGMPLTLTFFLSIMSCFHYLLYSVCLMVTLVLMNQLLCWSYFLEKVAFGYQGGVGKGEAQREFVCTLCQPLEVRRWTGYGQCLHVVYMCVLENRETAERWIDWQCLQRFHQSGGLWEC